MVFTIIIFAWRKPGMSPADFKEHYENIHVPLIKSIAGDKFPLTHSRHYVQRTPGESASSDNSNDAHPAVAFIGKPTDFDYDALAILTFEDAEKFQEFMAIVSEPEAAAKREEDEEKFIDRQKMTAASLDQVSVTHR